MNRTGVTIVVKWITWPHEVQYTAAGKPATYEDLSVSAFVRGYLIIMKYGDTKTKGNMTQHLEDCDLYGWDKVQVYHSIWLN